MLYSFPYVLLFLFFLLLAVLESKTSNDVVKKRIRVVCGIVFLIFFGLRGYIGTDWYNYQYWFQEVTTERWLIRAVEPGFSLLGFIAKFLDLDYSLFQFIVVSLQVFLFDRFMSKFSSNVSLSYVFLVALFPIVIIDLLRNFLAILVVINGLPHLIDNNNRKVFYLYVIAGMAFHLSSIVFFMLPFIKNKLFDKNILLLLFVVGLIVYFLRIDFYSGILNAIGNILGAGFKSLTDQVTSSSETEYGMNIGIIEKIILFLTIIMYYNSVKNISVIAVNCCLIYLLIYFYFSTSQSFINRFSNLFFWGYILVYIDLLSIIRRRKHYLLYFAYVLGFIFARTYLSYNDVIYKYSNRLLEEDNKYERTNNRNNHYQKR